MIWNGSLSEQEMSALKNSLQARIDPCPLAK